MAEAERRYELPIRRVFLDTNVLLIGAMMRASYAGQLESVRNDLTFVVSDYVLREAERIIRRAASTSRIANASVFTVRNFLSALGAIIVPEGDASRASAVTDEDDRPIYAAALHNRCDTICTYNLSDFPESYELRARSPLALLQQIGPGKGHLMVEYPVLGENGTLFIQGTLHHETSMGEILQSANGSRVFNDSRGYIQVEGPEVSRCKPKRQLSGNEWMSFFFRYQHSGHFEAVMWVADYSRPKADGGHEIKKVVLTEGHGRLEPPITPKLVFSGNFGFFGAVTNISGIPLFVRDRQVPSIIRNKSLEAVVGSVGVRELLSGCEFVELPNGEVYVGFRYPRGG